MTDPSHDRIGLDPHRGADDQNLDSDAPIVESLFPEDEPEPVVRRKLTARGAAALGARLVGGVAALAVAVVVIGGSAVVTVPSVESQAPSVLVTPVPTAQQIVCAGAVLRLSDETGQAATTPSAVGSGPDVAAGASDGETDAVPLETSDAGTGGTAAAPTLISTPPGDAQQRVLVSGAQSQAVAVGEIAGLAASSCAPATADAWFPAGSTIVGRTTLLTLSNPTDVPATVDIELFDEGGVVSAPGSSGIVVPPDGQRVLSVAGFAPDLVSPVLHVTSAGGQVVANLQQTVVRGLDPGGVDIVAPAAPLSTELVIPGLVIANVAGNQQLLSRGPDYADVAPALRVFAPGEGTVQATLAVFAEDGAAVGRALAFDFEAGRAIDVPLDGFEAPLQDGSYTIALTASVPVVAAVRSTAVGAPAADAVPSSDFAWLPSAPLLRERAQVTVADGPGAVLHLHNPADAAAEVTVGEQTVRIAAGATVALPVPGGDTIELSGFTQLAASVTLGEAGALAAYPVVPPGAVSTPVVVYP